MFLKSLTLRGFKTFADKTVIEFNPAGGITAIVGPNGCGKSNILDSVRWVLGEQSAKTLRTNQQQEVIFAGSSERKPLSMAEVTLLIDNSDKVLKSDYSEIAIKRRIFREGESEFFINKNVCRLKDIRDLFLDTGLGAGSYSIINQGQVDAILSSKPEDRRAIFEEAAGINKYKHRKLAAERKLIAADQNLLRVNDLKREISEQVEILSEQARRAQEYLDHKKRVRELELAICRKQLNSFSEKRNSLKTRIEEINHQMQSLTDKNRNLEEARRNTRQKIREIEGQEREARYKFAETISPELSDKIFEVENKLTRLNNQLRDIEEEQRFAEFEIGRDASSAEKYAMRLGQAEIEIISLSQFTEETQQKINRLIEEVKQLKEVEANHDNHQVLEEALISIKDLYNKISNISNEFISKFSSPETTDHLAKAMELSSQLGAIKEEFGQLTQRLETLVSAKKSVKEEIESKSKEEAENKVALAQKKVKLEALMAEVENFRNEVEALKAKVENRKQAIESIKLNQGELRQNIVDAEAEKTELQRMRQEEKNMQHQVLEGLIHQREELEKQLDEIEKESSQEGPDEREVQSELMKTEIALAKLEGENEGVEIRLRDEFGISIDELFSSQYENIAGATKVEVERVKQRMLDLEPVNFLAMEEYDKSKNRLSFIDEQYADLMTARENLKTLIFELDNKAKENFIKTIELVGENFTQVFSNLFEGGEARIVMLDPENVLESGIEIMARPYGRKMLNLSLLSGGERALTAIALLFALLKTHPSPFCFLDEVDAALDEANIRRFTKMLRDFSSDIQMVVITHSKTTMSSADMIYGITMQEPGISKIISMKLAQAA